MKNNIKYSILELATVSQGNTIKETLNNVLESAKVAEENGYERYWFAEHHNSEKAASAAIAILIGYVAENTNKIRVGAGGVMLPNHSPFIVAEQFGTLAQLYPNRIDLGLGRATGTDGVTSQAIRSDFMQAAHSFPSEIQKIQNYFSLANKSSNVRVGLAEGMDVPLYILGSSTDSAHLAARKGLPYAFASQFATTHLFDALHIYEQEFQPSEFLSAPYTIAGINVIMADTNEEAEKIFTSLIRMFYGMLTGNMQGVLAPVEMTDEWREILNHPRLQQMLKFSFVGDKENVKKQMIRFLKDTNVDEVIAVSTMYSAEARIKSVKLFAEVMQEINVNLQVEMK
ncbi:LLM class flavin-dependent oxidoreductase [uncultured Cytophaga sp.]|uniref:LLM class flavin-dependent oxidoreductase n=1 Tax=uncultured Cytophaga sp. TaxID=160238 RepID=UPI0026184BCB|nr:LLM class flavin-dependent oxidoreductase [uncultured Cytophaga sp.]